MQRKPTEENNAKPHAVCTKKVDDSGALRQKRRFMEDDDDDGGGGEARSEAMNIAGSNTHRFYCKIESHYASFFCCFGRVAGVDVVMR